jgi:signal transduction histidine kinase
LVGHVRDVETARRTEPGIVLLDDGVMGHPGIAKETAGRTKLLNNRGAQGAVMESTGQQSSRSEDTRHAGCEVSERGRSPHPKEAASQDLEVLRGALIRESQERRRAECRANMQTEVVKLALDLLVREPDVEGFFGALCKTMVEESDSHTCALWLIDDDVNRCELWMAYVKDRLFMPPKGVQPPPCETAASQKFPCETLANHLFRYTPGWSQTVEYIANDERLPAEILEFGRRMEWDAIVATPLLLGSRVLGWMTVSSTVVLEPESRWWRVVLIEAIARQAALALHHNRLVDLNRREERRKAMLEERNRLARDIHDNLAQGFAAILMQLQAAQRATRDIAPAIKTSLDVAIDLARTHLTEARRSVGTLRPNVGSDEDIGTSLKRLVDLGQRTTVVPIDLLVDELPRFGDGVEREIVAIAQEALTNAVRHSRARRITIRASTAQSVGLRLSVSDDGRGIAREPVSAGFGMTSMQERADRIGASLTIVTAPRNGTEVVLAWEPSALPTQVHVAG